MFLLDEIFSSELRSRVALADVFLKLECLVQSKDDLEKGDHKKFQRREQVESENEQQRRRKGEPGRTLLVDQTPKITSSSTHPAPPHSTELRFINENKLC